MLTGENGILTQAQNAKEETENAQAEEEKILANYESILNSYSGENTEFTDSLGNKVVVPAGFRVVNPEDKVEDGIIIEDVAHGNTAGSQFVWIPVGTIQTSKGEEIINLDRYIFAEDGTATAQGSSEINDATGHSCKELSISEYGNMTAKEIDVFLSKVDEAKGYYIGRYEARDGEETTVRTELASDTNHIVINDTNYIYNYITQPQASSLSQSMYTDTNFKSDLINSYAWDTALLFIQKCSGDSRYSQQSSLNTGSLASTGTDDDVKCNIYDMASNCREWTTETATEGNPCVRRGGSCNAATTYNDNYAASRAYGNENFEGSSYSFRPILYL